jgi:hypothetical protein
MNGDIAVHPRNGAGEQRFNGLIAVTLHHCKVDMRFNG